MNKSESINLRCLPEEKRALLKIARLERRRPSELLREWIRQEAQRRQLWPPTMRR